MLTVWRIIEIVSLAVALHYAPIVGLVFLVLYFTGNLACSHSTLRISRRQLRKLREEQDLAFKLAYEERLAWHEQRLLTC